MWAKAAEQVVRWAAWPSAFVIRGLEPWRPSGSRSSQSQELGGGASGAVPRNSKMRATIWRMCSSAGTQRSLFAQGDMHRPLVVVLGVGTQMTEAIGAQARHSPMRIPVARSNRRALQCKLQASNAAGDFFASTLYLN